MTDYQVFISRKNLDDSGRKAPEAEIAQELYDHLVSLGISVFLDDISLMQEGRGTYKREIDDALDAATVLIAVGTTRENLESSWVRYEWDGFFNDIISGIKPDGQVISLVSGLKPAHLPRALRQAQSFDYHRDGIEKIGEFLVNALGVGPSSARAAKRHRRGPAPVEEPTKVQVALLSMDVVGTSKLIEKHGDEIAQRIVAKTIRDWTKLTENNFGWVVESFEDDILCCFDTADDCVNAALEIQQEIAIGVRGESIKIGVRMGLSFGEATRHPDNKLSGSLVSVASRLGRLANAGEIFVDEATVKRLSPELRSRCEALGERSVSESEEPIRCCCIS